MKRPSAAMLVAVTALVSSVTGGAVAATVITSANIKDGTIQLRDLSPAARATLKAQRGPRGLPGAAGSQGVAGGFDLSKLSFIQGPQVKVPANGGLASPLVTCPAGSKAIGGGGGFESGGGGVVDDEVPTEFGWMVIVTNPYSVDSSANAYAICLAP